VPPDAGHRGQRVLSRLSGRERGAFASRLVQFAITRVSVPRHANGPDPEHPSVSTSRDRYGVGADRVNDINDDQLRVIRTLLGTLLLIRRPADARRGLPHRRPAAGLSAVEGARRCSPGRRGRTVLHRRCRQDLARRQSGGSPGRHHGAGRRSLGLGRRGHGHRRPGRGTGLRGGRYPSGPRQPHCGVPEFRSGRGRRRPERPWNSHSLHRRRDGCRLRRSVGGHEHVQ
jgi:hypothetical protein